MYIDSVPNRNSPPAILVRESYREHGKHKNERSPISPNCPPVPSNCYGCISEASRSVPKTCSIASTSCAPNPTAISPQCSAALRNCALEPLLASKRSRHRDLVTAMVVARIINPGSKLATARGLAGNEAGVVSQQLALGEVDENDLYDAMDWLLARQTRIEKGLAQRHLSNASLVLYDVTSTWFEVTSVRWQNTDTAATENAGKKQLTFGLLCDRDGCPVAIEAFKGNTGDPTTVASQIHKLRQRFGLERVVLVGDRGMLTSARIREDLQPEELLWISALRSSSIRALVSNGELQPSLFDQRDLAEISCESLFPGERLIVCRNPILAEHRQQRRQQLLQAAETALQEVAPGNPT